MSWSRSVAIAEGILAGSAELEREFVAHFLPRLSAFFRSRGNTLELLEELVQETLMAALLALRGGKLRNPEALESFVLGIARTLLAEAFRRQSRDPALSVGNEIEFQLDSPVLSQELHLTVRKEFDGLDKVDQQVLWLILVEGFRPAEVAGRVGLTEEAVRQRKSRLLRRLAEKIHAGAVTKSPPITTLHGKPLPGTSA